MGEKKTAKQALMDAKDKHARRWQTKEGTYCLKEKLLPDVRDTDVEMADISSVPQQTDHSEISLCVVSSMVAGYGQLNYVASCWSSTTEGASDVSPSHLFHFAYCTCRSFVVLGCFCALVFCVCFCVLHVQQASF